MSAWFSSNEALIQTALMWTLLAFSFQVVLRAGVFSLAGVGFWAIGGYATAIAVQHGWATVPAIAVSVAGSALVGCLLALILGRLRSLYLAMATVAFDLLVQTVASTWNSVTGGSQGLYAIPATMTTAGTAAVVVAAALVLWRLERGSTGRMLEAMRLDDRLAPARGIDVVRQRVFVFVLSAVLAALSGSINALLFSTMTPQQAGFGLIVATLTLIVIGGMSTGVGPLAGAFVVTWLPEKLTFLGNWWPAVQGLIVVLMVIYVSDGLVGLVGRSYRSARARVLALRTARVPVAKPAGEAERR
jgi:branched-chain amino acid transport system permease protein